MHVPFEEQRPAPLMIKIYAGKLFDSYSLDILCNQLVVISQDSGLIIEVHPFSDREAESIDFTDNTNVDLRGLTVLPGLVDAHVHFFLHPYSETSWNDQLTKEPLAERTVRATLHAKRTLLAGWTSVRDLGTEGAEDADIALRKCLSGPNPLIPGPRYFVANRAIVPTGAYGPKSAIRINQEGIEGITGAEVADGKDECIKAVRRQIGAGADWIKIYANYRFQSRIADVAPFRASTSMATFNHSELKAMITTAHNYGVKVACHATEHETIVQLEALGVQSIEHGYHLRPSIRHNASDQTRLTELIASFTRSGTFWVPTLAAVWTLRDSDRGAAWDTASALFRQMITLPGVERIMAVGGDTGVFAHGENALEMVLMARLGASPRRVLQWATLSGWRCIRSMGWEGEEGEERLHRAEQDLSEDPRVVGDNEVPFGAIKRGWAADIIAVHGDVDQAFGETINQKSVKFVMKGGRIFKQNGVEIL